MIQIFALKPISLNVSFLITSNFSSFELFQFTMWNARKHTKQNYVITYSWQLVSLLSIFRYL